MARSIVFLLVSLYVAMTMAKQTIYDFIVKSNHNEDYPLSHYDHTPVILVVNVASECGYTDVNYRELQKLYENYHEFGFSIIALPCNQFGGQEPGTFDEILNFAKSKYKISFDLYQKIDVNGPNTHPLFKWLKDSLGGGDVEWNFEKFIVVDGMPWKRIPYTTNPQEVEEDILYALANESEFHHPEYDDDEHDEL